MNKNLLHLFLWILIGTVLIIGFTLLNSSKSDATKKVNDEQYLSYGYMSQKFDSSSKIEKVQLTSYLMGIQEATLFMNIFSGKDGRSRLFCIPDKKSITEQEAMAIMADYYKNADEHDQKIYSDAPVSLIYIHSMANKFSCGKK